jgi:hypothetical protein
MPQQDGISMAAKAIKDSKKLLDSTGAGGKSSLATKSGRPSFQAPKPAAPAEPKKDEMGSASKGLLAATGHDQAPSLKANSDNLEAYKAAVPKMHKGGEVKEDGLKNLQKGEVVISKDKAEEGKKIMGLMNKAKSEMDNEPEEKSEGKRKTSDKHNPAKEEKSEKETKKKPAKKAKKTKGMHVSIATSGGYIAKHDMEKPTDGSVSSQEQEVHVLPDMAALHAHMADHMGEDEAQPGAAAAAAPAAEEAPAQA